MKVLLDQYPMTKWEIRKQLDKPEFREEVHKKLNERTRAEGAEKGINLEFFSSILFQPEVERFVELLFQTKDIQTFLITQTISKHLILHGEKMMDKMWRLYPEVTDHAACILWNGWTFFYKKWTDTPDNVVIVYVIFKGTNMDAGVAVCSTTMGLNVGSFGNKDIKQVIAVLVGLIVPFLQFADCETKVINATTNHKAKLNGEKYVTNIPNNIEIVDSRWFTTIIRSGGFEVEGHFRLQPFGTGRSGRRLQWIKAFEKQGYTRRSHIEIAREEKEN